MNTSVSFLLQKVPRKAEKTQSTDYQLVKYFKIAIAIIYNYLNINYLQKSLKYCWFQSPC